MPFYPHWEGVPRCFQLACFQSLPANRGTSVVVSSPLCTLGHDQKFASFPLVCNVPSLLWRMFGPFTCLALWNLTSSWRPTWLPWRRASCCYIVNLARMGLDLSLLLAGAGPGRSLPAGLAERVRPCTGAHSYHHNSSAQVGTAEETYMKTGVVNLAECSPCSFCFCFAYHVIHGAPCRAGGLSAPPSVLSTR